MRVQPAFGSVEEGVEVVADEAAAEVKGCGGEVGAGAQDGLGGADVVALVAVLLEAIVVEGGVGFQD